MFQGDSITDGGRGRSEDPNHIYGHSYVYLICARLAADRPDLELSFFNRGISGNRVSDLYGRWMEDTLNLKPDLLSLLAGINDVWFSINQGSGSEPARFDKTYRLLLDDTLEINPKTRFVLGEPFVLKTGPVAQRWEDYETRTKRLAEIVRKIARDYGANLVPYQSLFDEVCRRAPAAYWVWDGIHPTAAGHELMARAWLETLGLASPAG